MRARQLLRATAVLVLLAASSGPPYFSAHTVSSRRANPDWSAPIDNVAKAGDSKSIQDTRPMTVDLSATISSWLINPESDLAYLGAFRLPDEESNGTSWSYGGHGMGYHLDGDPSGPADGYPGSLFSISHPYQNFVSEFSISAPVISPDKDLADLPVATTLQPFADATADRQTGGLTGTTLGDIQYYPQQGDQTSDKLYWLMYEYYLPPYEGMGHGWCELDFTDLQSQGTWRLDDFPFSATSRYLFDIPASWADAHTPGKYLAAGRSRVVNGGSWGPALYGFGPWNDGNPPPDASSLDAVELLKYNGDYTLANYSHSGDWSDGAWLTVGDKSAVIIESDRQRYPARDKHLAHQLSEPERHPVHSHCRYHRHRPKPHPDRSDQPRLVHDDPQRYGRWHALLDRYDTGDAYGPLCISALNLESTVTTSV